MSYQFHTPDDDPPPLTDKREEQERLDKAIAEFYARGRKVSSTDADCPAPLSDNELLLKLQSLASDKKTLAEAAIALGQTLQRCRDVAVKHRIPFRSQSFLKRRTPK